MKPKLLAVAAIVAGVALPFAASTAEAVPPDMRHILVLLLAQGDDEAFAQLDNKQDGHIDRLEAAQNRRVETCFDRIDADGDGRISPEEWAAYRQKAR